MIFNFRPKDGFIYSRRAASTNSMPLMPHCQYQLCFYAPDVTVLLAGPVAVVGTATVDPAATVMVLSAPFTVTESPFGVVTMVPAGTNTDVLAGIVYVVPAARTASLEDELVESLLTEPPPPAQADNVAVKQNNKMARNRLVILILFSIVDGSDYSECGNSMEYSATVTQTQKNRPIARLGTIVF
jgi:hypothetical protein